MEKATWTLEEDKIAIRRVYRKLMRSFKSELVDEDKKQIKEAYELAVEAHKNQRRKSGEPYVLHPIEVARICVREIGLGPTAVICALLHDVVEDTDVTLDEIKTQFGKKVGRIVDGLTKLDGTYSYQSPQAENFKKVLSTLVEDVRVVLIKMADRLHNLRTIGPVPRHKQLKVASETNYIYAPLAHRLGLYQIKTEFQDQCMKITDPEAYEEIAHKLAESKRERQRYISEFIKPIKKKLDKEKIKYRTTGRSKSIFSIWNKIKNKHVNFNEIYDLFAIRIILDVAKNNEKQVCWQVYSLVTDVFKPIPERLKDWVTIPKSNGYESLHTSVVGPKGRFVEVQIRSERMDDIAERGFAAHWKYKGLSGQSNMYDHWLDGIREMLDTKHVDAMEFLNDFKTNLFNEELYIYTPKGDLKVLPMGATALDFAFSIHSDVGYHCKSVKVNNKIVPLGYKLENGDQVSVVTNKAQKPNENWLKMVVTGKARGKIRSAMKEERRIKGETGKEALQRKLKSLKVDFEENVDEIVKHYGFVSRPDLYYAIAEENFSIRDLREFEIIGNKLIIEAKKLAAQKIEPRIERKKSGKIKLLINGESADQYKYQLAACCNPVMGDDIFAFTSAHGMKVHRFTCSNATHLMANYGYRVLRAEWVTSVDSSFVVELEITGLDEGVGVIERLTSMISTDLGLNIRALSIAGDESVFKGNVKLLIKNKDQLNMAIRSIKKLAGISAVVRIE